MIFDSTTVRQRLLKDCYFSGPPEKYDYETALDEFLWEAEALRARMLGLADWHDVKAHKAMHYPGEGTLNQAVMLKAAKVHLDAANRIREALEGVADDY